LDALDDVEGKVELLLDMEMLEKDQLNL